MAMPHLALATTFPTYPQLAVKECAVSANIDGAAIGAQPMEDVSEQKKFFKTSMASKGFIPVYIVIKNETTDESFLIEKSKITYSAATSNAPTQPDVTNSVPRFLFGAFVKDPFAVQQNLIKQELQSATLPPGASVRGFLYLQMKGNPVREKISVKIPVEFSKAGKLLQLAVII